MLQQFKISAQAIIIFLFGILFLHAATATVVGAQGGAHSHREFRNLESQIQNLTQRVEALESAELTDAPTEPSASGEAQDSPDYKAAPPGKEGFISKQAALNLSGAVKDFMISEQHDKFGQRTKPIEDAMDQCNVDDSKIYWPYTSGRCFCSKKHEISVTTLCAPFR